MARLRTAPLAPPKAYRSHRPASNRKIPPYLKCSASSVITARSCPLQAFFSIFLGLTGPPGPMNAFGTAVHAMFEKSLHRHASTKRYPYSTIKKLNGAWWNFWSTAAWRPTTDAEHEQAHGFGGYREPWVDVSWRDYPAEPERMRQQGCAVMAMFFKAFDPYRQSDVPIWVERSFAFRWEHVYWTGRIDTIIFEPDGAIIIDHKPYDYTEPVRLTGVQATFYQLAYEMLFRQNAPGRLPLKAIRIYNYRTGRFQDVPIRDSHEIGMLVKIAQEYILYYSGTLKGIVPPPELQREFHLFNANDILRGDITPNLPRGKHCDYCPFIALCRQWERGLLPPARVQYERLLIARAEESQPWQIRIPFSELAAVQHGRLAYDQLMVVKPTQTELSL